MWSYAFRLRDFIPIHVFDTCCTCITIFSIKVDFLSFAQPFSSIPIRKLSKMFKWCIQLILKTFGFILRKFWPFMFWYRFFCSLVYYLKSMWWPDQVFMTSTYIPSTSYHHRLGLSLINRYSAYKSNINHIQQENTCTWVFKSLQNHSFKIHPSI